MRSRSSLKRSLPCLAVLIAFSAAAIPAHAGIYGNFINMIQNFPGVKKAPVIPQSSPAYKANPAAGVSQNQDHYSVEKHFVLETFNFFQKNTPSTIDNNLRLGSQVLPEKVALVNTETHTEIIPEYTEKGLVFRFRYDDVALQNPKLLLKDLVSLDGLLSSKIRPPGYEGKSSTIISTVPLTLVQEVSSPHAVAEILNNVRAGSASAKARWNDMQMGFLSKAFLKIEVANDLNIDANSIADVYQDLEQKKIALDLAATQEARKQQKKIDTWRRDTQVLDHYEAMTDKLDDLILKNDRAGVRKMLEAYLPWAVMESVEANTWKIWLDAIENPNLEKTTVGFRGLNYDTDKVQRKQTAQGEVLGFMSTVLTRNQGSYTRRLRSLSTNREKNGDIGFKSHGSSVRSVKITDQMTAHAHDPVASSFMSFTYSPRVAMAFLGKNVTKTNVKGETFSVPNGGMLVVRMDSRRLLPNLPSMHGGEIELLAPLIVFPDEVVSYREGAFNSREALDGYVKEISVKTGFDFDKGDDRFAEKYRADGLKFLSEMNTLPGFARSCSGIFSN